MGAVVEKIDGFSKYEYGSGWKEIIGSTASYESMARLGYGAWMLCSRSYTWSMNCWWRECSIASIVSDDEARSGGRHEAGSDYIWSVNSVEGGEVS